MDILFTLLVFADSELDLTALSDGDGFIKTAY